MEVIVPQTAEEKEQVKFILKIIFTAILMARNAVGTAGPKELVSHAESAVNAIVK